jgi:hypothetical protein
MAVPQKKGGDYLRLLEIAFVQTQDLVLSIINIVQGISSNAPPAVALNSAALNNQPTTSLQIGSSSTNALTTNLINVKEKLLQLFIEYRRSYIDNELEVVDL